MQSFSVSERSSIKEENLESDSGRRQGNRSMSRVAWSYKPGHRTEFRV